MKDLETLHQDTRLTVIKLHNVVAVRWHAHPVRADLRIFRWVLQELPVREGGKYTLVSIAGVEINTHLDLRTRLEISALSSLAERHFRFAFVVLEGTGFWLTALRSTISGFRLLIPTLPVEVFSDSSMLVPWLRARRGNDPDAVHFYIQQAMEATRKREQPETPVEKTTVRNLDTSGKFRVATNVDAIVLEGHLQLEDGKSFGESVVQSFPMGHGDLMVDLSRVDSISPEFRIQCRNTLWSYRTRIRTVVLRGGSSVIQTSFRTLFVSLGINEQKMLATG